MALVFCVDFNRWFDCAKHLNRQVCTSDIKDYLMTSTDALLAAQTAIIAAKALGIDSLVTASLYRLPFEEVFKILSLPDRYCFLLVSVCLGYGNKNPSSLKIVYIKE